MRAVVACFTLLLPVAAAADEPGLIGGTGPTPPPAATPRAGHAGQVGLSLALPLGLRAIRPYDEAYCGSESPDTSTGFAPVCVGRAPMAFDLIASYGVLPALEVVLDVRIGLERDVGARPGEDGPRVFHLAPGVRAFYSDGGDSKLFSTGQLVLDLTGQGDSGADVGVRNANGLWFHKGERWGWYLFVAETLSFARWLRFEFEGGVAIQGRL